MCIFSMITVALTTSLFTIFMLRFVGYLSDDNKLLKNLERYESEKKWRQLNRQDNSDKWNTNNKKED